MKFYVPALLALAFVALPGMASAEINVNVNTRAMVDTATTRATARTNIATTVIDRMELRQENQEERAEMRQDNREERRALLENRIANIRMNIASHTDAVKARITANVQERVELHANRIFATLDNSLSALASFEDKIETRLDALEDKDIDVSLSREKLAAAHEVYLTAEANIADLKTQFDAEISSETTAADLVAIMQSARAELQAVRRAYAEVLLQIRVDVGASVTTSAN